MSQIIHEGQIPVVFGTGIDGFQKWKQHIEITIEKTKGDLELLRRQHNWEKQRLSNQVNLLNSINSTILELSKVDEPDLV